MALRCSCLLVALLSVVALPRVAQASMSPSMSQCVAESDNVEGEAAFTLNESEDCVVDADNPDTVPLCLLEGASASAGRIVHGISDARIDAPSRCSDIDSPDLIDGSHDKAPGDPRSKAPDATVHALAEASVFAHLTILCRIRDQRDGRPGHLSGVYRPPRA